MKSFAVQLLIGLGMLSAAGSANAQEPARGKDLFVKYTCYGCHGFSGQNGPGARLVPMKMTQAGFIGYVRNPPRPNMMPSYSAKVLPDADMGDLYAYLKSMKDASRPADDIPLLKGMLSQEKSAAK